MDWPRVLLCFCLAFVYGTQGWQDLNTAEKVLHRKTRSLDGEENGSLKQRARVSRRNTRRRLAGKYRFNLKKIAIHDAENRNALCLGEWRRRSTILYSYRAFVCALFLFQRLEAITWSHQLSQKDYKMISTNQCVTLIIFPLRIIAARILSGRISNEFIRLIRNWSCGFLYCIHSADRTSGQQWTWISMRTCSGGSVSAPQSNLY